MSSLLWQSVIVPFWMSHSHSNTVGSRAITLEMLKLAAVVHPHSSIIFNPVGRRIICVAPSFGV